MNEQWPAAMRADTAAQYLDVSPRTVTGLADKGLIQRVYVTDRAPRFLRKDLDTYLETCRKPKQSAKAEEPGTLEGLRSGGDWLKQQ